MSGLPVDNLPDAAARERIRTDHDTTLIVEAAAGTGKTTSVVRRVVEFLGAGTAGIGQLAAITFTEKAAGELRLRIRQGLETAIEREDGGSAERAGRLETALSQLEEASIGTIHAFCATILRERPIEAGVDPDFEILTEGPQRAFFREVFRRFVEEQLDNPGPGVARLLRRSRSPARSPIELLEDAGRRLLEYRRFEAPWTRKEWDAAGAVRSLVGEPLEARGDGRRKAGGKPRVLPSLNMIEELYGALPKDPPGQRPNWLVRSLSQAADLAREIRVREEAGGTDVDWLEQALAELNVPSYGGRRIPGFPQTRDWRDGFRERLLDFQQASNADLAALLREDLRGLVRAYEDAKQRAGKLDFDDLLLRTRDLLRGDRAVREELAGRFRHLVVDEYQDTDPLQTEIALLLTADEPPDGEWRTAIPKPGRLCLVGDPKQSIYRFRRADIGHYLEVRDRLVAGGAAVVRLTTNFRSTPGICDFVNKVMEPQFASAPGIGGLARQVDYSPLHAFREPMGVQPALAAIRVSDCRYPGQLEGEEPAAVAAFVARLLDSGFEVSSAEGGETRAAQPSDICLLFRRFRTFRKLVPQAYADALRERGIPHSLGAVESYVGSAEISCLRAALTAIEFPEDELSVYATLRGPLFSIPDQDLFLFRERHPDIRLRPALARRLELDQAAAPADGTIREALSFLYRLHRRRSHQPIALTLQRLVGEHRSETGFAFWKSPDQVLSNLRRLSESARAFEADGGLSFRAFVEQLAAEAENPDAGGAYAMDDDVTGVRIMTIHNAKGLEFPVVILADAAVRRTGRASRIVRPDRNLYACDLGGRMAPWDLIEGTPAEEAEDLAELDRLLYVGLTRARDLLAAPAAEVEFPAESLLAPVAAGLRPFVPRAAGGADRPEDQPSGTPTRESPLWKLLKESGGTGETDDGAALEAAFWSRRAQTLRDAGVPRRRVATAKALAAVEFAGEAVEVHALPRDPGRPRGIAFGDLVHRILEEIPFDAPAPAVQQEAARAVRGLDLPADMASAAASTVIETLGHGLLAEAREAEGRGACYRELPLLHFEDGLPVGPADPSPETGFDAASTLEADAAEDGMATPAEGGEIQAPGIQGSGNGPLLVDGVADLIFRTEADGPWTVLDFKTDPRDPADPDFAATEARYRRQVSLYARALERATGQPARAVLLYV